MGVRIWSEVNTLADLADAQSRVAMTGKVPEGLGSSRLEIVDRRSAKVLTSLTHPSDSV